MKLSKNFVLILIILIISSYCSKENEHRINREKDEIRRDDDKSFQPPNVPKGILNKEEEKFKNDLEEKMKENRLLKEQIENKLKYIKILFITGIILFLIIVFILIQICIGKKKKRLNQKEPQIPQIQELKKSQNNDINLNSRIDKSNFNIINSKSNLSISTSISFSSNNPNQQISNNNNSVVNENNGNDIDSNRIEGISNEIINDDNKTLTNNPDIFISSRTDKMLYKPYSEEEIENSNKK